MGGRRGWINGNQTIGGRGRGWAGAADVWSNWGGFALCPGLLSVYWGLSTAMRGRHLERACCPPAVAIWHSSEALPPCRFRGLLPLNLPLASTTACACHPSDCPSGPPLNLSYPQRCGGGSVLESCVSPMFLREADAGSRAVCCDCCCATCH